MADDEQHETSQTVDPLVVWGVWRARKERGRPTPSAWVVLGVLLGVPTVLIGVVVLLVTTR